MTSGWNGSAQKLRHKISGGSPGGLFYDPSISYASKRSFYGLLVGFNHLEAWLLTQEWPMLEIIWNQIRNPRIELEKVTTDFFEIPSRTHFSNIYLNFVAWLSIFYVFSYKNLDLNDIIWKNLRFLFLLDSDFKLGSKRHLPLVWTLVWEASLVSRRVWYHLWLWAMKMVSHRVFMTLL